jgi:DNA-binding phage protein
MKVANDNLCGSLRFYYRRDPEFRRALLASAINELIAGDYDVAKAILRDYINATITFPELAKQLGKSAKSIHRMLGPNGNPRIKRGSRNITIWCKAKLTLPK